jgi:hypothetical protein
MVFWTHFQPSPSLNLYSHPLILSLSAYNINQPHHVLRFATHVRTFQCSVKKKKKKLFPGGLDTGRHLWNTNATHVGSVSIQRNVTLGVMRATDSFVAYSSLNVIRCTQHKALNSFKTVLQCVWTYINLAHKSGTGLDIFAEWIHGISI